LGRAWELSADALVTRTQLLRRSAAGEAGEGVRGPLTRRLRRSRE
jgi:hypothetical protein